MMSPSAERDLRQHGLQPLLELAAILGAGDHRAEVERHQLLALERLRHVAVDDAQRQALGDGGLADAGLADQHGVVLGAAGQHLDGAADLLVAADHRVELAVARRLGEVAGVLLERVVAVLGAGAESAVRPLRSSAIAFSSACGFTPAVGQRLGGVGALGQRQRQQQALDGDEAVARLLGDRFGLVEHARRLGRHVELARALAFDLGLLGQRRLDRAMHGAGIAACGGDQVGREALRIVQQDLQEVVGKEALVPFAQRQHLGALQEAAHAVGVLLLVHHSTLSFDAPDQRQAKERTPIRASCARYGEERPRRKTGQRRMAFPCNDCRAMKIVDMP